MISERNLRVYSEIKSSEMIKIKVNVKDEYPDVYMTRRILNDGAKYFGPYASAGSAKEMIEFIKSLI